MRKEIMSGINLTCIRSPKFKTNCISVSLIKQLDKKTAAMAALLPRVLRRGTVRYQDMDSLNAALDELYGAEIEAMVRKKGELQCVGFYADFIDDAYIPAGENILEKVIMLLGELLLMPVTVGGRLNQQYVESEKQKLKDRIAAAIDNKIQYSVKCATELMCAHERYGVNVLGTQEDVDKITVGRLTKFYRELIATAPVEIVYCGNAEAQRVEAAVLDALGAIPRAENIEDTRTQVILEPEHEPAYYQEQLDVSQGKLVLGFRLGETMRMPNYPMLKLLNAVYGGSVTSKLFMNVREKLSLCYFASSSIDRTKGVMFVISGIEFDKFQPAVDEMLLQLDKCKNGEISDDELEGAKRYVVTELRTIADNLYRLEDYYFSQFFRQCNVLARRNGRACGNGN